MKRTPFRLVLPLLAACCLLIAAPLPAEDEEGPTVKEIREKIKEQIEEAEEEEDEYPYEDDEEEGSLFGFFVELFARTLQILLLNSLTVRYAEYPYAALQAIPFGYQTLYYDMEDPDYPRLGYANLCLDGAYLQQDRWGVAGRLSFNLLPLHLHGYSQVLFDPTDRIIFYSFDGGLTLPSHRFILNLFAGVFFADLYPRAMFSFGASAQLFLPGKLILDVYNINAVYHSVAINYLSVSLNRALAAVNLGVGFNLNHYAGTLLMGPLVRITFWL